MPEHVLLNSRIVSSVSCLDTNLHTSALAANLRRFVTLTAPTH